MITLIILSCDAEKLGPSGASRFRVMPKLSATSPLYLASRTCHKRQLEGLERKAKVEGSQLRLYKAKEGSRKHEAIACLNILGSPT